MAAYCTIPGISGWPQWSNNKPRRQLSYARIHSWRYRSGWTVVRRLHSLGHEITAFHRGEHEAELPAGVRYMHGEFAQLADEAFDPTPDVVVYVWVMTEMDAESFLNRFRGVVSRAVVISSGDVYRAYGRLTGLEPGLPHPVPLTEDAPLRKSRDRYRSSAPAPDHWMTQYEKTLVEQVLTRQTDLPACVLRFPAVIGPNEYRRFHRWLHQCCEATWNCVFKMDGQDGAGPTVSPRTSPKPSSLPRRIRGLQDESTT